MKHGQRVIFLNIFYIYHGDRLLECAIWQPQDDNVTSENCSTLNTWTYWDLDGVLTSQVGVQGAERVISYPFPLTLTLHPLSSSKLLLLIQIQTKSVFLSESSNPSKWTKLAAPFNAFRILFTNFYYTIYCNIFMFTFQNQIWIPDSKDLVLLSCASLAVSRMPSPHWLGMVSGGCSNKGPQTWRLTQITLSQFWRPEVQTQEIAGPPPL